MKQQAGRAANPLFSPKAKAKTTDTNIITL